MSALNKLTDGFSCNDETQCTGPNVHSSHCYCWLLYPSSLPLPSSLFLLLPKAWKLHSLWMSHNAHRSIVRIHPCLRSPLHPRWSGEPPFPASLLLSLPHSHHSRYQAPRLRCMRLPSPSLGAPLWVLGSAASASLLLQYAALPRCWDCAARAKRGTASYLGSGEGKGREVKHFYSCRKTRQRQDSRAHLQTEKPWIFTGVYWFVLLELQKCLLVSTVTYQNSL